MSNSSIEKRSKTVSNENKFEKEEKEGKKKASKEEGQERRVET